MAELDFPQDKIDLIKSTVAKGATDDELALFLHQANKAGLDPLARQIHFVKRKNSGTIQVGIDGLRAIADRTKCYAPGEESFEYNKDSTLYPVKATVSIKKFAQNTWHELSCTARWVEYAAYYGNNLGNMWNKFPETMLAKCAEAKALRKAFPAQLSGLYTHEEMHQADSDPTSPQERKKNAAQSNVVDSKAIPEKTSDKPDVIDHKQILTPGIDIPDEALVIKSDISQIIYELCDDSNQIADLLEALSEFRSGDVLKVKGCRSIGELNFTRKKGKKMSQAQAVLKKLMKLHKEQVPKMIDDWKAGK